jgi:hypothetical protein
MWAFIYIDYKALMLMFLAAGHILPEVSSDIFEILFYFSCTKLPLNPTQSLGNTIPCVAIYTVHGVYSGGALY